MRRENVSVVEMGRESDGEAERGNVRVVERERERDAEKMGEGARCDWAEREARMRGERKRERFYFRIYLPL